MLKKVVACSSSCGVGHATIGLTNLANYSVQGRATFLGLRVEIG